MPCKAITCFKCSDMCLAGQDQTRGWFYTLMVLSTALFDKPAFKNLVCNGLVLADDGKKMSKRLKNYPVSIMIPHLITLYYRAFVYWIMLGTFVAPSRRLFAVAQVLS